MTSSGEPIRVSFRAAVHPRDISRLSVSCTPTKNSRLSKDRLSYLYDERVVSMVVAAHANFILLILGHRYSGTNCWHYSSDFFVYRVGSMRPPTLRLLPTSYTSTPPHHIGLICDGDTDDEFVAADLEIKQTYSCIDNDYTPVEAVLYVLRSRSPRCSWEATVPQPRIRHTKGQGDKLVSWSTDEVVPCAGLLCYVDYSLGVLFLDNLTGCNPELRYVRLPTGKISVADPYDGLGTYVRRERRGCPERGLCSTTDGGRIIKFVDVVTTTVFVSRTRATASALFTIKVWRLRREYKDTMTWEKESELEDADLWSQQGYGDMPRVAPTFPRVSMEEPNVVYFVLSNHRQVDEEETCVIAVDMLNKSLLSSFKYTKASKSLAHNGGFIPCEFSKGLLGPAG
ncbi:unnamed protein product [Alopecurus aequalis]